MNISQPISSQISSISFSYLTSSDIRKISVKQVVNPVLFNNLNEPNKGGLYDPAFGPLNRGDMYVHVLIALVVVSQVRADPPLPSNFVENSCSTCKLNSYDCPGHFGHIELPQPMYHPLYLIQAYQLLRGTCTYCHHFLISEALVFKYIARLSLLERGLVVEANELTKINIIGAASSGDKKKHDKDATLPDREVGDSTLEPGQVDPDDEDSQVESIEDFGIRLKTFVARAIKRATKIDPSSTTRDEYKKSGTVYDQRKKVIAEFVKLLAGKKKCTRCGAFAHRLRKEGHTKIVEYSLVGKQIAIHASKGIKRMKMRDLMMASTLTKEGTTLAKDEEAMEVDQERDHDEVDDNRSSADSMTSEDEDEDDDPLADDRDVGAVRRQTERIVPASEVRAHLRLLFKNEAEIIALLYAPHGPLSSTRPDASADIFFMDVVAVPPTRFRPASTMGDQVFENPQNALLNGILRQTFVVRDLNVNLANAQKTILAANANGVVEGEKPAVDPTRLYIQLLESLINLQVAVNSMMDSSKNPMVVKQGKLPPPGVKQLLEKKEGLFRQNMMGKRVNYAARSVISPDVNIETNEIGVPPVFARKLTLPEPVTDHNVQLLRQMVINGPHQHPGAAFVQMEDGHLLSLDKLSIEDRTAHANKLLAPESRASATSRLDRPDVGLPSTRSPQINRKVYRHLQDGDIVILNRQPTLHKPSMMCHRVRVLKGEKTIRMHYANCNSYNADFDGDEMNIHFPQSLIAQAEARLIANTDNQYLVPTSGNPLRGLIQDHVVAGVWLTNKDTFFTREQYQQLIYGALRSEDEYSGEDGLLKTLPPTIWKPRPLWTGKQVISTLLLNIKPRHAAGINFTCKAKVPGTMWGPAHVTEEQVVFVDGELLCGILDKAQIGASPYGLVHSVYELYGATIAGKLLSILSRVLTKFLQSRAFTCRMDDLLLTPQGNADRRKMLQTVNAKGLGAALDYVGLGEADRSDPTTAEDLRDRLEEVLRDDYKLAGLDATVEGETNGVTTSLIKTCLPGGLVKPFPHNHMQTMTVSGAKGSNVNASQISCLLGQQSLEGRRVPTMVSGKTLPSFKPFETAPRAGGFVAGRFLTGIRPQEYYFHCMAGREGLIDTAVKTSRSGYLQRCLIKHLEGLRVHYDHTVRNSDQSVLQFQYGEDGLDVTKQKHLHQIEFTVRNTASLVQRYSPKEVLNRVLDLGEGPSKEALKHPDRVTPILSRLSPSTHLGSISETYAAAIENYIKTNPQRLLRTKKKHRADWPAFVRTDELMDLAHFRSLMYMRYMQSLVEPGEAVGLMASQGVGEPSTQMTLNTFHFAGHGPANVTLGIPRLREIVMTASQHIKTPTMQLPILANVTDGDLATFCQDSTRLTLSQGVDEVTVRETLSAKTAANNHSRQKLYTIRLGLFPREDYEKEHAIEAEQILACIERQFVYLLDKAILKEIKQNEKENKSQASGMGKGTKVSETGGRARAEGEDDDADAAGDEDLPAPHRGRTGAEEDGEDADADDAKRGKRMNDEQEYESDEDEDEEATKAKRKAKKSSKKASKQDPIELDGEIAMDEDALEAAFRSDSDDSSSESSESESEAEEDDAPRPKKLGKAARMQRLTALERKAADQSRFVDKVTFDKVDGGWCELELEFSSRAHKLLLVGIVEGVCRQTVIHEIPGISRCFVAKVAASKDAAQRNCMTEGVNLRATWHFGHDVVDLNNIYTNDIGAILRTYGVEAARTSIIKEMSGVFSVYGIGVDYRHLTIIADYMTSEGQYKPFNRTGLSNNSSPFLKASFETTANFVAEAALFGDFDDLGTPSANIVLGKAPVSGTGVFDVAMAVEA
ncbi:BQ2448_2832 [Microbotryum intermedium]|uniref:DNA-directed RNA polymerase subunit n=1 Tax=Microbotryum intermedium TaxID=269621 RepID=A0A238FH75_9BASI|nr:BQ2448_2832 [Microbotryum intermedium]